MAQYQRIAALLSLFLLACAARATAQPAVGPDGLVPVVRVAQLNGGATFNGSIQPGTTGGFDPYADPALQPPAILNPGGGYGTAPAYGAPAYAAPFPNSTFTTGPQASSPNGSYLFAQPNGEIAYLPRLMQDMRGRYTWIRKPNDRDVGFNTVEAEATFLFPFFHSPTPILLSPGGAINFTDGPDGPTMANPTQLADLPAQLYDLYLDGAWRPQVTERIALDLGIRGGIYTDFDAFDSNAVRLQGRGLVVFNYTQNVELRGGVVFLDRVDVNLLPAGGVVWTPDENRRFEILFPNPKLSWRLSQYGNADFWFFVAGEYGGGSWLIQRDAVGMMAPVDELVDYNDIRVSIGLDWSTPRGLKGLVEVGYVFNRELVYEKTPADNMDLDSTLMLRGGLEF